MTDIIGITGNMGSGKSTLAKILKEKHGFVVMSFAAPIKEMLKALLVTSGCEPAVATGFLYGNLKDHPCSFLCGRTMRHAMQTLGSEWRDLIDRELWTTIWHNRVRSIENSDSITTVHPLRIVVDDVRFLHEARAIKKFNGTIVKVVRGASVNHTHVSETELEQIKSDFIINNTGAPEDMLVGFSEFLK